MREFNVPIDFFKNSQAFRFQIYSIIRKKVQESYMIGIETVGDQIQKRVPSFELFLSVVDIEMIKSISQQMLDQFWIRTQKLLTRETATIEKENVKVEKKKFDIESAIERLSSLIVFTSYNKAVTSKLQNVISASSQLGLGITGAFSITDIFKTVGQKISDVFGSLLGLERIQDLKAQEMFLTKEDEKVCPICEPFNRRTFEVDSPDKPNPQLHDWCRCVLVPIVSDEPETLFNEVS